MPTSTIPYQWIACNFPKAFMEELLKGMTCAEFSSIHLLTEKLAQASLKPNVKLESRIMNWFPYHF